MDEPRYTVRVDARGRHGFAVVEDHETGDNAAVFTGPDAPQQAQIAADTLAADDQIAAWQARHADTPTLAKGAYWMIDAREADHAEALAMERARKKYAQTTASGSAARPVCLRVDGTHVGHMAAVTDECRTEIHQDPHDAAGEALHRAIDRVIANPPPGLSVERVGDERIRIQRTEG